MDKIKTYESFSSDLKDLHNKQEDEIINIKIKHNNDFKVFYKKHKETIEYYATTLIDEYDAIVARGPSESGFNIEFDFNYDDETADKLSKEVNILSAKLASEYDYLSFIFGVRDVLGNPLVLMRGLLSNFSKIKEINTLINSHNKGYANKVINTTKIDIIIKIS